MFARRSVPVCVSAVVFAVSACAEKSPAGCPSGYCGNVVGMLYAEPETLFPPVIQRAEDQAIANLIFFPLADIGNDLNTTDPSTFIPRLARSWTFEDSLTLVFDMDPRATWHDGTPVTAHDVAFTFSVYMDTLLSVPSRDYMESIDRVTARDDRTAVFRFNRSYREQFYAATYHMRILPRHLLDAIPRNQLSSSPFTTNPIGNGPYRFVAWNPGQSVELAADTSFFLGRPGFPHIEWRFATDPNTILTPLLSEDADILSTVAGPENIALVESTPYLTLHKYPGNYYGYLAFNYVDPADHSRPHPIFSDPTVRRAIALAIDRGLVARTAHGDLAVPPSQPATPMVRVYRDTVPVLPFDTAGAKRLLADDGWRDSNGDGVLDRGGRDLAFELITPTTSAARMQSSAVIASLLEQIGIKVTQTSSDYGVFSNRMVRGNFDAYIGTWFVQPSPAGIRGTWASPGIGSQNYSSYSNATFDSLVQRAYVEPDAERENHLWGEAFAAMNNDPGAIWIYAPDNYAAIHRRFEGVFLRPDRWSSSLWQWRVRDGEWLPRDLNP